VAEAEERKLAAEAEEWKLAAEEWRVVAAAEAKEKKALQEFELEWKKAEEWKLAAKEKKALRELDLNDYMAKFDNITKENFYICFSSFVTVVKDIIDKHAPYKPLTRKNSLSFR